MQSVAVLNDVHGNLAALRAVLNELDSEQIEVIVCGGDLLLGPYQSECLALLRARRTRFLTGNCERDVLRATDKLHAWCRAQLRDDELEFIESWPAFVELEIDGLGDVYFCHGSPRNDEEMLTMLTPDDAAAESLHGVGAEVIVIGHTHHQFDRRIESARLVNAGSVGLPYEGKAAAFWALLGPTVDLRMTNYNVAAGFEEIQKSGMPEVDEVFRDSLLEPASPEEAAAYFERQKGREPLTGSTH